MNNETICDIEYIRSTLEHIEGSMRPYAERRPLYSNSIVVNCGVLLHLQLVTSN